MPLPANALATDGLPCSAVFQEPYIFDAEEEDVDALSALHVLSAEEEGFELRSSSGDVTDAADADAGTLANSSGARS